MPRPRPRDCSHGFGVGSGAGVFKLPGLARPSLCGSAGRAGRTGPEGAQRPGGRRPPRRELPVDKGGMRVGWGAPTDSLCPQLGPRPSVPGFARTRSFVAGSLTGFSHQSLHCTPFRGRSPNPRPASDPSSQVALEWLDGSSTRCSLAGKPTRGCLAALPRPPGLERQRGAPRVLSARPPPPSAQASRTRAGCPGDLKPMQEARAAGDSSEHQELCVPLAAASKMGRGMLYFRSFSHLAF